MPQIARERMYLTKDKTRLVPQNHKLAGTLYAAKGDEIPDSAAQRFGVKDGLMKGSAAKEADVDNDDGKLTAPRKQGKQAGNKQTPAPANKETGGGENK